MTAVLPVHTLLLYPRNHFSKENFKGYVKKMLGKYIMKLKL